jgi:M6 family metalloprotease-like protein
VLLCILPLFSFLVVPAANGLDPPRPGELESLKKTGEYGKRLKHALELGNNRIGKHLLENAAAKIRPRVVPMAPPPSWAGMQTKGDAKALALLIEFPDYPHRNTPAEIAESLFGEGPPSNGFLDSLKNYYARSSYGQLSISGGILGWYTTVDNSSALDIENTPWYTLRENVIKEALNYYKSQGYDFSPYDADNDGYIDCLMVFWSVPQGTWGSFWWGYFIGSFDANFLLSGKRIRDYTWQPAYDNVLGVMNLRTVIHEVGHVLGLPDYYDYSPDYGPNGGLGGIDMMDSAAWDHNCFSKWVLDWISPVVVASGSRNLTLNPSGISNDAVLVMPNVTANDIFSEFFMVQNRGRTGNDGNFAYNGNEYQFPNNGLLIWHVDATLNASKTDYFYNNQSATHKLLRLMEADGLEEIELGTGRANAGDFYVPGKIFGNLSTPSSRNYAGQATGVTVSGIAGDVTVNGGLWSATVSVVPSSVSVTVNSSPPGRQIVVDGTTRTTPASFTWEGGSQHTLETASPQSGAVGTRYVFASWSDGGAQSHSVTSLSDATYTASFTTEHRLTTAVSPAGSGSVTPSCAGGCWYAGGSPVSLLAVPADGYSFGGWTGDVSGTANPQTLTMNAPVGATAGFTAIPAAPNLSVSPAEGLSSSGPRGGPFSPASAQYTIRNTGGVSLDWTATRVRAWAEVSPSGGTLGAGQSATVTVSIGFAAGDLVAGSYSDTVTFANTTDGSGNSTRGVSLVVNEAAGGAGNGGGGSGGGGGGCSVGGRSGAGTPWDLAAVYIVLVLLLSCRRPKGSPLR